MLATDYNVDAKQKKPADMKYHVETEKHSNEKGQCCTVYWLLWKNGTQRALQKHVLWFTRVARNLRHKSKMLKPVLC
jgi:hypothetical protein